MTMSRSTLDLRGLNCPMPVLKTRKAIRAMAPRAQLLVESTDPLSVIDLPNYCREDGHTLLDYSEENGVHAFLIERGDRPLAG